MDEITRRKEVVLERKTDRERWQEEANFEAHWSPRSSFAAALCGSSKWVCDVGCGMQSLRNLLPAHATYLPADLKKWTDDTFTCDLNAGEFPKKYAEISDVLCFLGVIEYIYDLDALFENASRHTDRVVVSYNPTDIAESDRRGYGWVNDLTVGALVRLVHEHGFIVDSLQKIDGSQVILRMRNSRFSWKRGLRRAAARMWFKPPA
jgi:hypothetical protein